MIVITTIDALPDYCRECPCHDGDYGYCQADKEQRYSEYRPYWCPLREIHDDPGGKPEQKFFVDSDGKMTPLPIQKHGHWISVKDNRPKDQKPVIVYVPPHTNKYGDEFIGYVGMAYYTYSVNGGYWCGTDGNVYGAIGTIAAPSHWTPLPEPPEVKP